jgi:hypothetical protein
MPHFELDHPINKDKPYENEMSVPELQPSSSSLHDTPRRKIHTNLWWQANKWNREEENARLPIRATHYFTFSLTQSLVKRRFQKDCEVSEYSSICALVCVWINIFIDVEISELNCLRTPESCEGRKTTTLLRWLRAPLIPWMKWWGKCVWEMSNLYLTLAIAIIEQHHCVVNVNHRQQRRRISNWNVWPMIMMVMLWLVGKFFAKQSFQHHHHHHHLGVWNSRLASAVFNGIKASEWNQHTPAITLHIFSKHFSFTDSNRRRHHYKISINIYTSIRTCLRP